MIGKSRIRLLERVGQVVQWGVLVCAIWVLSKTVFLSKELPQPAMAQPPQTRDIAFAPPTETALEDLSAIWKRDLRQTLIEVKTVAAPQEPEKPKPPPVKLPQLLATFVEQGESWGVFVNRKGERRVRRAGSRIDECDIVAISSGSANLRRSDKDYEITVARKTPAMKRSSHASRIKR